ncbi:carboxypeptidase O-like [Hyla sarda]|uniref:carboxypeptidase O-like n=1 Tax=Hyla sarda TaxID=327740 RepID=UPI0024C44237|nr:carboxypeptidase O-like [Hyla sarda]
MLNDPLQKSQKCRRMEHSLGLDLRNVFIVSKHSKRSMECWRLDKNREVGKWDGDQVWSIIPETLSHAVYIKEICNDVQFDLWKPSHIEDIYPGREVHLRVSSPRLHDTKQNLHREKILFHVLIDDVQKLIDEQFVLKHRHKRSLTSFQYTEYHPMNEIYDWMDQIKETHKDLVTLHYLGSTYETRPIYYFKIGQPSNRQKKIIWMDCGIHAREWISVAFCQWFIREILHNHHNNPVIKKALDNMDFYIVPVLNIDGFIYSWTTDRLWRKSRSPHNNGSCYGVDLNRNFDSNWCLIGASKNCSSLTFCGSGPASEPEVQALSQLVTTHKSDILCFLTMHSYGQLILLPYGYTKDPSVNHDEKLSVGQAAASKIKETHGLNYTVGSASHILYSNSGSSRDWATDLEIPFSYTFELRDNGTYGFVLPEDQIQPTCEEATAAIISIVHYLNEKHFNGASGSFSDTLLINLSFSLAKSAHHQIKWNVSSGAMYGIVIDLQQFCCHELLTGMNLALLLEELGLKGCSQVSQDRLWTSEDLYPMGVEHLCCGFGCKIFNWYDYNPLGIVIHHGESIRIPSLVRTHFVTKGKVFKPSGGLLHDNALEHPTLQETAVTIRLIFTLIRGGGRQGDPLG